MNIYVARHGQDLDNVNGILNGRRDQPLSAKGIEQATLVAEEIRQTGLTFDRIFTSPLQRARKTAEIIATLTKSPDPEPLDLLIERDFGVMTGKHKDEIEKLCSPDIIKAELITYFLSPENAETFPDLLERSKQLFDYLKGLNDSETGNYLLVTHGDIGKMIYCAYYDLDWRSVLTMFHFGNSELLLLSPDSKPEEVYFIKTAQYNS